MDLCFEHLLKRPAFQRQFKNEYVYQEWHMEEFIKLLSIKPYSVKWNSCDYWCSADCARIARWISLNLRDWDKRTEKLKDLILHTKEYYDILYDEGYYEQRLKNHQNKRDLDIENQIKSWKKTPAVSVRLGKNILIQNWEEQLRIFFQKYPNNLLSIDNKICICDLLLHSFNLLEDYEKLLNLIPNSSEYFKIRHPKEKIEEMKKKKIENAENNFTNVRSYWINKGYSEEEAIEQVSKVQKLRSNKVKNRDNNPRKIIYWINNGYSEEEAKKQVGNVQNRRKDYFIEKYGLELGIEKWELKIKKWQESLRSKNPEEIDRINKAKGRTFKELAEQFGFDKASDIIKKRCYENISRSKKADLFFQYLDDNNAGLKEISITGYKNAERWFRIENNLYFVDYFYNGKIIEYFGCMWHGDPNFYSGDDLHPVSKMLYENIWNLDKKRIIDLQSLGYEVLVVWEKDIDKNREAIIQQCINFLGVTNEKHKINNDSIV